MSILQGGSSRRADAIDKTPGQSLLSSNMLARGHQFERGIDAKVSSKHKNWLKPKLEKSKA